MTTVTPPEVPSRRKRRPAVAGAATFVLALLSCAFTTSCVHDQGPRDRHLDPSPAAGGESPRTLAIDSLSAATAAARPPALAVAAGATAPDARPWASPGARPEARGSVRVAPPGAPPPSGEAPAARPASLLLPTTLTAAAGAAILAQARGKATERPAPAAGSDPRQPLSPAPSGSRPRSPAAPRTAKAAAELWRSRGEAALGDLADYFETTPVLAAPAAHGDELHEAFVLLRGIASKVRPENELAAPLVVRAIRGFLRVENTSSIRLPDELFSPPWQVVLRLILGLRPSTELGEMLVAVAREELDRLAVSPASVGASRSASPAGLPCRLRNAVYGIAYLRHLPGLPEVRKFAELSSGEDLITALEMLAELGHADGGEFALAVLDKSTDVRELAAAAGTARELLGDAAEAPLVRLARNADPNLSRAAIQPLFSLSTPRALETVISLRDAAADSRLVRLVDSQLAGCGQALRMRREEVAELLRASPEKAAERLRPISQRLEQVSPTDRRLSPEDLRMVLDHWREHGTIYTEEWSWVRERHIRDAATKDDLPRLEAVRMSVLRLYHKTCDYEANILQRMFSAVQRDSASGGKKPHPSR